MELAVALDLATKEANLDLARELRDFNIWMKVGLRSYIRDGKEFLEELKIINPNFKIFLDLKLYDIPNTMADAAQEIAQMGVEMFNVHASAGERALKMVMERLSAFSHRPLVLAVTALTSFAPQEFEAIYGASIEEKAKEFATMSFQAGLDGVVCSVYESRLIKKSTAPNFLTLTPGIRPFGEDANDQKRVATIEDAKEAQVDFIVVGRPIYKASNPKEVVEHILTKL